MFENDPHSRHVDWRRLKKRKHSKITNFKDVPNASQQIWIENKHPLLRPTGKAATINRRRGVGRLVDENAKWKWTRVRSSGELEEGAYVPRRAADHRRRVIVDPRWPSQPTTSQAYANRILGGPQLRSSVEIQWTCAEVVWVG